MKIVFKTAFVLITLLISTEIIAIDCEARLDFHDDYAPVHKKTLLEMKFDATAYKIYAAQIENVHYSVTINNDNSYNMGIYFGPEYTSGTRVSGTLSDDSNLRLSFVKMQNAYNIICH